MELGTLPSGGLFHTSKPHGIGGAMLEDAGGNSSAEDLNLLRDGIRLHPVPTADPLDPLLFSRTTKWMAMGIVVWLYFLFTYVTTTTVPSFPHLQAQYAISYAQVNWTVAIPALGLGIGPLFWSSLADIYGRRLIIIAGTGIAFLATICCPVVDSYKKYMTCRFFQGFGVSPAATVGMAIINDLFFDYERGHKFGLWVLALDMGLLVGPLVGGFITLVSHHWVQWLTAILFGVVFCAELFFLPETLYPRKFMLLKLGPGAQGVEKVKGIELLRTKTLPFLNLKPVPGIEHPKLWDPILSTAQLFAFPNVSVSILSYCVLWYWWVLSVVTYIPAAYSSYSPHTQGLFYIGMIIGTLFSEMFCSGAFGDWLMRRSARKYGRRIPEARLWTAYPAILITVFGLVLWSISVEKKMHLIVGQVALFFFAAGIQMGNTCFSAYIVDCYPMHSMSVVTFYSVFLNLSAFVNPFFIAYWVESQGFIRTFCAQAAIAAAMLPITVVLQNYGGRWRERFGEPGYISPEYKTRI